MKLPFLHKKEENISFTPKEQVKLKIFNTLDQDGYYCYSADDLLTSDEFRPIVDKISTALGGRRELFDKYLLPSISQVALYCQKIPASEVKGGKPSNVFGHHMSEGGLLLHSLETMYFALNDSRLAFFNKGINPSERDSHMISARIACGLAGLLHDIGKLNDPIVVTYKKENGKNIEYVWNCIESIPDFLARVHEIKTSQVFISESNPKPPTYVIKGWKKGRNDKHEIIAPFLMRSFVSKATLKLITDGSEEILHNFMTAVDWRVLANDYTNARQNIIYDIWSRADTTSSEKDRKTLSKNSLAPIKTNLEIKKQLIKAFQFCIDRAEVSVNRAADECYIFSHATGHDAKPFVVMIRFDDKSLGMWLSVISKASDFYKSDILQDHEPNLDNIKELLNQCDFLLPANTADGFYTVEKLISGGKKEQWKAICIADYKNVILQNGQLYLAQENDLFSLKVKFADGIEPVIVSKDVKPLEDLSSDLGDPKAKQKKDAKKKQKPVKPAKVDVPAEDRNDTSENSGVDELQLESYAVQMKAKIKEPTQADMTPISDEEADRLSAMVNDTINKSLPDEDEDETDEENNEEQQEEVVPYGADEIATPEIVSAFESCSDTVQTDEMTDAVPVEDETVTEISAPAGFGDSDEIASSFAMGLFMQNIKETASSNEEIKEKIQEAATVRIEPEPDDRPLILSENEIRNFDRAIYDYKEKQKELVDLQKPNAIKLKELETNKNNEHKPDNRIFQSVDEPYYNGLTVDVVKAIKQLCERIKDKKTAKFLSIQICNRLTEKAFSYIDFVTVDNKYCYAAYVWNNSVKKDANGLQYVTMFDEAGLFPHHFSEMLNFSKELYYFEHIQMIKAVTNIFKIAGMKPLKIKCKDHPFENMTTDVNGKSIVEYVKHKIISLDYNEELYGYKPKGYAHERRGRRIDKEVLRKCSEAYNISLKQTKNFLAISSQITPPYMVVDGNELVVGYQKQLKAEELKEQEQIKNAPKGNSKDMAKETEAVGIAEMPYFPF